MGALELGIKSRLGGGCLVYIKQSNCKKKKIGNNSFQWREITSGITNALVSFSSPFAWDFQSIRCTSVVVILLNIIFSVIGGTSDGHQKQNDFRRT